MKIEEPLDASRRPNSNLSLIETISKSSWWLPIISILETSGLDRKRGKFVLRSNPITNCPEMNYSALQIDNIIKMLVLSLMNMLRSMNPYHAPTDYEVTLGTTWPSRDNHVITTWLLHFQMCIWSMLEQRSNVQVSQPKTSPKTTPIALH